MIWSVNRCVRESKFAPLFALEYWNFILFICVLIVFIHFLIQSNTTIINKLDYATGFPAVHYGGDSSSFTFTNTVIWSLFVFLPSRSVIYPRQPPAVSASASVCSRALRQKWLLQLLLLLVVSESCTFNLPRQVPHKLLQQVHFQQSHEAACFIVMTTMVTIVRQRLFIIWNL